GGRRRGARQQDQSPHGLPLRHRERPDEDGLYRPGQARAGARAARLRGRGHPRFHGRGRGRGPGVGPHPLRRRDRRERLRRTGDSGSDTHGRDPRARGGIARRVHGHDAGPPRLGHRRALRRLPGQELFGDWDGHQRDRTLPHPRRRGARDARYQIHRRRPSQRGVARQRPRGGPRRPDDAASCGQDRTRSHERQRRHEHVRRAGEGADGPRERRGGPLDRHPLQLGRPARRDALRPHPQHPAPRVPLRFGEHGRRGARERRDRSGRRPAGPALRPRRIYRNVL
ncbi:Iron-sulfur cluster-binding protein, partial [uncultured Rubrobacteraceae bacterium]